MTYRGTHSHNSKIQIESTLQQNNVRVGGRRRGLRGERRGGRERRGVGVEVGAGICPELEPEFVRSWNRKFQKWAAPLILFATLINSK